MIAEFLTNIVSNLGYIGMFLVSFIGALSIFLPIPYTTLILFFSSKMDPILLSISSGLGAGLGEVSGYLLGLAGRKALSKEEKKRVEKIKLFLGKYGLLAVFIFALTPLPDDLLFIPLGLMRYPIAPVLLVCIFGKILMSYFIAIFGKIYFSTFEIEENLTMGVLSLILLIILIFIMLKVKWEKLIDKLR